MQFPSFDFVRACIRRQRCNYLNKSWNVKTGKYVKLLKIAAVNTNLLTHLYNTSLFKKTTKCCKATFIKITVFNSLNISNLCNKYFRNFRCFFAKIVHLLVCSHSRQTNRFKTSWEIDEVALFINFTLKCFLQLVTASDWFFQDSTPLTINPNYPFKLLHKIDSD